MVVLKTVTARVKGGFSHRDIIDFGGPVREITWVVRFNGFQLKGGD